MGHTADEYVEVLRDVELFEQQVQQPARPWEAGRAFSQPLKVLETAVLSPVVDLALYGGPGV